MSTINIINSKFNATNVHNGDLKKPLVDSEETPETSTGITNKVFIFLLNHIVYFAGMPHKGIPGVLTVDTKTRRRFFNKTLPWIQSTQQKIMNREVEIQEEHCLKGEKGEILEEEYEEIEQGKPIKKKRFLESAEGRKAKREALEAYYNEPFEYEATENISLDYEKFEQHEKDFFKDMSEPIREAYSIIILNLPPTIEEEY